MCGAENAPGKKFCTTCGAPLEESPAAPARPPQFQPPAMLPPLGEPDSDYAPPQPPPRIPPAPQVERPSENIPMAPGVDPALINELLRDEIKKKKRTAMPWRKAEFWFAIGTALLIPSILLPWLHLYPGNSTNAFHLPLSFLITGQAAGAPWLSAGTLLVACIMICGALTIVKNRIVTYIRFASWLSILLALLAVVFAFRSWKAMDAAPGNYPSYVQAQSRALLDAYGGVYKFFGVIEPAEANNIKLDAMKAESGIGFMKKALAPGFAFALAGGIFILAATFVFAKSQRFISYNIATTPMAAIIVGAVIVAGLLIARFFFPGTWYLITSTAYQTANMRNKEEDALKKCSGLPVPPVSCETRLAKLYFDTKRKGDAMKLYAAISKKYPNYVEVDKYIGLIYFSWEDHGDASWHLRKFMKQYPSDMEAREKLSASLIVLASDDMIYRRYGDALSKLKEAYSVFPVARNDETLNYKLGTLYEWKGDIKKAAIHYSRAADINTKNFDLYKQAASTFEAAGDNTQALAYYEKCTKVKPDELSCYKLAGDICRDKLKDNSLAAQWYRSGLDVTDVGVGAEDLKAALADVEK